MLELALAACRILLDQPGGSGASSAAANQTLLCGASIPAPLLLVQPSGSVVVASCKINAAQGSLLVQTNTGGTHMAAAVASSGRQASEPAVLASQLAAQPLLAAVLLLGNMQHTVFPYLKQPTVVAALADAGASCSSGSTGDIAEYKMHPAALDAAIHAGAVLGLGSSTADSPRLSIPAGLAAFALPTTQLGSSQAAWATVGNVIASHSDGSAKSDFQAVPTASVSTGMQLSQLLSRPLRHTASKPAAQRLQYQVQWRAAELAAMQQPEGGSLPVNSHAKLAWLVPAQQHVGALAVRLQPVNGSPAAVVNSSIAWLQDASRQPGGLRRSIGLHASAGPLASLAGIRGGRSPSSGNLMAAGVAGLMRSVAREQGSTDLYCLMSSSLSTVPPAQHSAGSLADTYGSSAAAGALFLPRLVSDSAAEEVQGSSRAPLAGQVLVTGGLGDLGLLVGTWLSRQSGSVHTVLLGRSAHSRQLPSELRFAEGAVTVTMADVGCSEDVAALRGTSNGSCQPLSGIMHAGGVLADALLPGQTAAGVRAVLAPKVHGAQRLLQLASSAPIQHAALFSSTAALIGPAGQANYSAANAMLGALAEVQQNGGLSSVSILWGAWSVGMVGKDAALAARITSSGMGLITPSAGLQALAAAVGQQQHSSLPASLVVNPFSWQRLQQAARGTVPAIFEDFSSGSGIQAADSIAHVSGQHMQLHAAPAQKAVTRVAAAVSVEDVAQQISSLVRAVVGTEVRALLQLVPSIRGNICLPVG